MPSTQLMGRPPVLLLVEDSEDDAELTQRAFHRLGRECLVVLIRDGQEAIDYLLYKGLHEDRSPVENPSLVLLDLKLPRKSGLEVLRAIRGSPLTRSVPVVVLSSSAEPKDIDSCYTAGANSYLRKPVAFDEFLATVELLAHYWLDTNLPPAEETERG